MSEITNIIYKAKFEAESNWIKASMILSKAIEDFPAEKKLYDELGNLYFKKGMPEKAAETYKKAVDIDKSDTDLTYKTAYCLLLNEEYEKAIEYFDLIGDTIPEAIYNKCISLYHINRVQKAIELLEELIEKNNYSERPFILLGKIYLEYERYGKAIAMTNTALELYPNSHELLYIRGVAYFNIKEWMKAYLDFESAESKLDKSPIFFRIYALTSEKIGMTEKSLQLLRECIRMFPESEKAIFDMIRILIIHNRHKEALELTDLVHKKPDGTVDKRKKTAFFNNFMKTVQKNDD